MDGCCHDGENLRILINSVQALFIVIETVLYICYDNIGHVPAD